MNWISVKDKLPEVHLDVLIYIPWLKDHFDSSSYIVGYLEYDECIYFNNFQDNIERIDIKYISHWMPLPEPPKE